MSELLGILRRNEAQTFIRNAQIVREYRDCPERADAAREQVHRAMYCSALGQITLDERDRILSILAPCCPDLFATPPSLSPSHSITTGTGNSF